MTCREQAYAILRSVNQAILGKEAFTAKIMAAFLAEGHVLLEDVPGVGKTTLAVAFSRALGFSWKRVQFTPDVTPSDLTGFSIYQKEQNTFTYQPGAVFCNLLLADELNRTSPKTQSALLEVMEEGQTTVDGVTRPLPRPFLVIATQNPFGAAGTQPLPTAQADRFSLSLSMGYPAFEDEVRLAHEAEKGRRRDQTEPISDCESFSRMCREASGVYIHDSLCRYIVSLVDATRNQELFELGASPRSTLSLVKLSKTLAWLQGENYVTPSQIKELFPDVVKHRVVISHKARRQGISRDALLEDILRKTAVPLDSLKGPVNHLKHLF